MRETKCIISHLRRNHLATNSRLKSRQASSRSHSDKVAAIIIPNTRQNLEQSCLKQFFLGLCPVCNYGNYSNEPPSLNFKPQHQVASIELTRGMGHHDDLETRNSPILTQFYNLMSPKLLGSNTESNFPVFSLLSCLSNLKYSVLVSKMTFLFRDDVVDQCFEYWKLSKYLVINRLESSSTPLRLLFRAENTSGFKSDIQQKYEGPLESILWRVLSAFKLPAKCMGYFGSNYVKMFYEFIDVDKTLKLTLAVNLSYVCPRPTLHN